ncbi:MAG: ATP phosphoribosyltransferase [Coriobacteriales bacterium]|nr:ATP phosphoribosyltransferase [Coriobacteriales bacterium]
MSNANASRVFGQRPLRVAIPKGSLYKDSLAAFTAAGLDTSGLHDPGRQLVIYNDDVEFYILRPTDIPVFVNSGGVDCAICGKDSLVESALEVVELVDLGFGACRFVVARPASAAKGTEPLNASGAASIAGARRLKVATKYPHITQHYYDSIGVQVEIVKMHGNIELAPLAHMADCIVDITATGTTLRENNLEIEDDVLASTARFVGNVASTRIDGRVRNLANAMRKAL